tara:strand:- start:73 stop:246 length:174 start_codon:yes stop_codon:yes gene_type:complete
MTKTKTYAVVDLNSGFVYATFTNRRKAEKMVKEFQRLDKMNGVLDVAESYGVIIEKS